MGPDDQKYSIFVIILPSMHAYQQIFKIINRRRVVVVEYIY